MLLLLLNICGSRQIFHTYSSGDIKYLLPLLNFSLFTTSNIYDDYDYMFPKDSDVLNTMVPLKTSIIVGNNFLRGYIIDFDGFHMSISGFNPKYKLCGRYESEIFLMQWRQIEEHLNVLCGLLHSIS